MSKYTELLSEYLENNELPTIFDEIKLTNQKTIENLTEGPEDNWWFYVKIKTYKMSEV